MQPYPYEKGKKITVLGPPGAGPNFNGSSRTQRHWVLVEAGLKFIGSCCNDPTTLSDLQTEKTTPPTGATVSSTVKHSVSIVKYSIGSSWDAGPNAIGMFWKCFGSDLSIRPNSFCQRMSHPQPQFLTKKRKGTPLGCYIVVHSANTL
jgi:hypothetical protein